MRDASPPLLYERRFQAMESERGGNPMHIDRKQLTGRRWGARRRSSRRVLVLVILLGLLGLWHTGEAAAFTCPAGDVACLINAINTANANEDTNTITLAAGT